MKPGSKIRDVNTRLILLTLAAGLLSASAQNTSTGKPPAKIPADQTRAYSTQLLGRLGLVVWTSNGESQIGWLERRFMHCLNTPVALDGNWSPAWLSLRMLPEKNLPAIKPESCPPSLNIYSDQEVREAIMRDNSYADPKAVSVVTALMRERQKTAEAALKPDVKRCFMTLACR